MRIIALALCLWSSVVFARFGDWSSGGGILRTSENPWFLSNTKSIRYCVEMDPQNFSNLPTPVETQIDFAFRYWRGNFAAAATPSLNGDPEALRMATQTIVYQPACDSQTDIVFYLGQLPPNIGNYISDPASFIGVTVRTDYDEVNLRGKGFVYISADDGPLAYSGEFLRHGAWHVGKGGLLFKILVHELGHVFGLPHIHENIVMDERFPERVLSPLSSDLNLIWPAFEGTLLNGVVDERCFSSMKTEPFLDFFEVPKAVRGSFCYRMIFDIKSGVGAIYYAQNASAKMVLLGSISNTRAYVSTLGGIYVWLPANQTVFPGLSPYTTLQGVQAMHRQITGTYISVTGQQKQIFFNLTPYNWVAGATIGGVLDGKVVFDLFH